MGLSCFKSWKHDSVGNKGNRDVLASPGSYFFLSNSAGQGDEWLKSLNKGVWIPFTGVFGQRLEETVLYERRYGIRLVPLIVEQCVTFIRDHGLHEDGLFRLPGQANLIEELKEAFDSGERPSFDSNTDVHTVASLLKLYLRQLPEPLVPFSHYQQFLFCGQKLLSERTLGLGELRNLLCELPFANFNLVNFICQFLYEVQSFSSSNKMSIQILATVFGPNIFRAKAEDPQSVMGGATLIQVLMLELIREHESLFAKVPPHSSTHLPGSLQASPSRAPHLQPSHGCRQLSLPLISESSRPPGQSSQASSCISSSAAKSDFPSDQKRHLGHRYTSSHPENCFYPRPSSSQSIRNNNGQTSMDYWSPAAQQPSTVNIQASKSSNPVEPLPDKSWEQVWMSLGEGFSGFWSSGAAEEVASGGSSEAQEDSTLSTYDNLSICLHQRQEVGGGPLNPGGHLGASEEEDQKKGSPLWSSCEILPLDEGDDAADVVDPETSTKGVKPEEPGHKNNDDNEDEDEGEDEVYYPTSPASCSVPSDSPLSTGSSDVFLPSVPQDQQGPETQTQPSDAESLLSKLQQEMALQRAEYQAKILRLERCNDILKHQIAVLRISLEQQKRSQSVAEIKIRNMERFRADADLRNTALQREMEVFFQTYGQLKTGGVGGRGGASL